MNEIERRLRDALASRAGEVEPHDEDDALARISERVNMNRRRGLILAGAAAAIFVVAGALVLVTRGDDKSNVKVGTGSTASSSESTATTSTTVTSTVLPVDRAEIWPLASMNRTFSTPEEAAKSFAVDYLGMTLARVGATTTGDPTKVEIFPNDTASTRTVVSLVNRGAKGWAVVGADADELKLDHPVAHDAVTDPITISGQGTAFEATIAIELRPYGSLTPVLQDNTMGGSNGEIGPFSKTIRPPSTDEAYVLLVYEADASDRGKMTKATVVPLDGPLQPADFVAITSSDELVHLDFDGHIQRTLAEQVANFVYSPAAQLVAYSPLGETCTTKFLSLSGGHVPSEFPGTAVIISADGATLTYLRCNTMPAEYVIRDLTTGTDTATTTFPVPTPQGAPTPPVATVRGRFGTTAFFDGTQISSYTPSTGAVVALVTPPAEPLWLDADDSGRFLIWVDVNGDLWTWSGNDPVQRAKGFKSAAW